MKRILISLIILGLLTTYTSLAHTEYIKPVVIVAEKSGNRTIYTVNAKRTTLPQMLDRIGEHLTAQTIQKAKAFILAGDGVTIGEVQNLEGLIQKVGLGKIRFFNFCNETKKMIELKFFGPVIPFTTDPAALSKIK